MERTTHLIVPMLQAFYWFDEGLQDYFESHGYEPATRAQSMVILSIMSGVQHPSEIARNLGISRQAVHHTLSQMVEMNLIELVPNPHDKRSKLAVFAKSSENRRDDGRKALTLLEKGLEKRIGKRNVQNLRKAFAADWGDPIKTGKE